MPQGYRYCGVTGDSWEFREHRHINWHWVLVLGKKKHLLKNKWFMEVVELLDKQLEENEDLV